MKNETVERRLNIGVKCECGWGMWQSEHGTLFCTNGGCPYAGVEYDAPVVALKRAVRNAEETEKEADDL